MVDSSNERRPHPDEGTGAHPRFHPASPTRARVGTLNLAYGEDRRTLLAFGPQLRGGVPPDRRGRFAPMAFPLSTMMPAYSPSSSPFRGSIGARPIGVNRPAG